MFSLIFVLFICKGQKVICLVCFLPAETGHRINVTTTGNNLYQVVSAPKHFGPTRSRRFNSVQQSKIILYIIVVLISCWCNYVYNIKRCKLVNCTRHPNTSIIAPHYFKTFQYYVIPIVFNFVFLVRQGK